MHYVLIKTLRGNVEEEGVPKAAIMRKLEVRPGDVNRP
jgi:hypothetical protein